MALPAIQITLNTVRKVDPTRTLVLRNQFVMQVNKRFRDLKGAINRLLTKDNFLDPVKPTEYQPGIIPIGLAAKYEYMRSDVKVEQFMGWLKDQESQGILEIIQRPGGLRRGQSQAWSDTYIRSSYSKGIAQGRADLRKLGADIPSFEQIPGGISSVFNQPFHADRVALCYTRCFNGMKGVTEAMNGYLSRELALGMAGGQSPYAIAKRINERVDKIGIVRGRLIARTEIIQSHNEAALNEYERAEIEIGETVKVEWVATMDNRVRPHHAERDGKIYERSVAREMLGEPNCRCGLAPYVESLDKKLPKAPVKKAVGEFVPAETIKEAEKRFNKSGVKYVSSPGKGTNTWAKENTYLKNALNPTLEELERVKQEFPGLGKSLKKEGNNIWDIKFYRGRYLPKYETGERAGILADYSRLRAIRIAITDTARASKPSLSIGKRTLTVGKDFRTSLRHEMGHHYFDVIAQRKRSRFQQIWRDSGRNEYFKGKVSLYSGTNIDEAFAECFSAKTSPLYGGKKKLPKVIDDFLEGLLR